MESTAYRAIAIVGVAAVLPDAPNAVAFWENIKQGRYSITEVTPDRWDPALYYDPDPSAPDKSYSKIGGWVRKHVWDPVKWRLAIPPRVVEGMDEGQKWAISCTREALLDYGYPQRPLDLDRTAVILGNAMAGEKHYFTCLRIYFPEYARELEESATFAALPAAIRRDIRRELHQRMTKLLPVVTEDTMPGELSNCIAGRVANVFNIHGPNYVCDAACASAMAAISSAVRGLVERDFDVAITGGIDRNMGATSFVKFCKIGALSATGSRPYAEGADGFVMGEGAALFVMKRLADAERDGDKIYAVLRGMGGSSDGKGKGITAPNPVGQRFAIERGWKNAGLSPATATLFEGHGTSTKVGDRVEAESLISVLQDDSLPPASIALGSVKSNVGHLKSSAGAAAFLKVTLALRDKVVPPSVNFKRPNPDIDFAHSPLYVPTELTPWTVKGDGVRRAGLSAFGFGGTNFHAVMEEYIPHRITGGNGKRTVSVGQISSVVTESAPMNAPAMSAGVQPTVCKAPLRGAAVIGAATETALVERARQVHREAQAGRAPAPAAPREADLRAPERLVIDYADVSELANKAGTALKAFAANQAGMWKALRAQGIFRGHGPASRVAFLYTGQGSQYVNMLKPLCAIDPIVADMFAEADRIMAPILGKALTDFIFVDERNADAVARAEDELRQTAICQPAVLATDLGLTRLLAAYGVEPDMTMGHSLGEYGALIAAGALPFEDALEAVAARGREMTRVSMSDNGKMAAVFAPMTEIERITKEVNGYVVIANINSNNQAVVGGASQAVEQAIERFLKAGYNAVPLPVSHAFHTSIVAPASEPLRQVLQRLRLQPPRLPIVANVDGDFYPTGPSVVPQMLDILARQVAAPVQFIKGLQTLYKAGARVFVELGPKKALQGFADDVLGSDPDVVSLFTNHPKIGDVVSFNQALCGLYAAGLGRGVAEVKDEPAARTAVQAPAPPVNVTANAPQPPSPATSFSDDRYTALGHLFADFIERSSQIFQGHGTPQAAAPVVITGAALGLPGTDHIFDDANIARILRGDQFIDVVPTRLRQAMLDKHITRLVKSDNGGPTFETITDIADVIKLAARGGAFDIESEYGLSAERVAALDRVTRLAIAAGIDALRDAGIPLVMRYKTTTKGTQLPDRWTLPDDLRDDTGVVFASAFPGYDSLIEDVSSYHADRARRDQVAMLERLRARVDGDSVIGQEIDRRLQELREVIAKEPYIFDRRFLFRVLSMGHSQFAEYIGARGPNTQVNAACASTALAVSVAQDWIHAGRCRRVIIVSADDVTSDRMLEWFAAGFLATGAAATDEVVEDAATPFDRRRHGMIVGMGAAAVVIESADAVRERGLQPICEVLGTVIANSAFHGTRLDIQHISQVMESLVMQAESRHGISRRQIARQMMFMSHETYTPARGGSASAEIYALRRVFGDVADQVVIANTKGFTGHAMGTGMEDVVAIKALETGCVPPVPNFREVDPELGNLNLSRGGVYPVEYAIHLGAGFGSQISLTLLRHVPTQTGARPAPTALGYEYRIVDPAAWNAWLARMSGYSRADLEVVNRTLRVHDRGAARVAAPAVEARPALPPIAVAALPGPPKAVVETKAAAAAASSSATVVVPVTTAAPPVSPVSPALALARPAGDLVREKILALVAEKTGYPSDMLDLDLDLEADLGVDTVKQAEVFAAVREAYGIARDDTIKLRDFPTLKHVIQFVHTRRPDLAVPEPPKAETKPETPPPAPTVAVDPVKERVLALVVEKTGYPPEMLDLDLDLEADLGVDTVKQAELFGAIRGIYDIPRDENLKLRDFPTLAKVIQFVYDRRPDLAVVSAPPAPAAVAEPAKVVPVITPVVVADPIRDKVLEIVAEKTGYPPEMLDVDLDLEADLGIDTVKQAEMFASVRATFNIPRGENLKLRDFPTLAHVIQFARERAGSPQTAIAAEGVPAPALPVVPARPVVASFDAANRIPRRVPVPVLRPPLTMCKATAVTLSPGARVVIMPDKAGVAAALADKLKTMEVEVLRLDPAADADGLGPMLATWLKAGSVQGVYWLPALDHEGQLSEMDLPAWKEALRLRLKLLYHTMRTLYEQVGGPDTFLVAGVRLGGQHGYDEAGAVAPLGGAVVGFTKAYKREKPDCVAKAVDFEPERPAEEIADLLLEETLRDPGAVEIGYKSGQRWTVGLREQPAADGQPGLELGKHSIFLITGAAGSIVSAITADLAAASGGTFYLLDLVPEPAADNPDLKRFVSDKDNLKRDLFARIQQRGERATPALVEKELAALERAVAAHNAIDAVTAAGGSAHYFSVNLTDAEAVARVIEQVRERIGRIDVLLHAAGMERSHFLPDKEPREFGLVFDVKSDGWFNLLHAIGDMPLAATVAFSSIAGRFGNGGQTDYSSANDLLCKITSNFRSSRPATRAIAIDWTAWGGIGMATRGSIPKMMELAGIDMLPPEAGIPFIRRELTTGGTRGEVVCAQRLGIMVNEFDPTGGLDTDALTASAGQRGPMAARVTSMTLFGGLTVEAALDPVVQPFLHDHQIDGTPVLPGVMGIEAFAEAALCVAPGWRVEAVENVNFLAPFKFYRNEPRTVAVQTVFFPQGDALLADCRLIGRRQLPNQPEPQETTYFTARVRLIKHAPEIVTLAAPGRPAGAVIQAADVYKVYFHGPAYQVIELAWQDGERTVGRMRKQLPPNHVPAELPTTMAPRLIELCFQTAGLWEMGVQGRMGLPRHVDSVSLLRSPDLVEGQFYAVVRPHPEQESFDAEVIDSAGNRYIVLAGYRTVALPNTVNTEAFKILQGPRIFQAAAD